MEFHLAIPQDNAYARTHPLTGQRISVLESMYQKDPAWDTPTDPALEARFQRIKAKLAGYVLDPKQTLIRYPESDQSIPARYARSYAWHRSEERRVGQECVSTCRSRWSPYHQKKHIYSTTMQIKTHKH